MKEEKTYKHESYGMLGFNRATGSSRNLFGSSISHNNTIIMRVKTASVDRKLNCDWYHGEKQLIEIEMSYTQFVEAITHMNSGDGVPITLRRVYGKSMEDTPFISKRKEFEDEIKQNVKEVNVKAKKLISEINDVFQSSGISKKNKDKILNALQQLNQEIESNMPYLQTCFNEQMDKTVTEAKGEIEAFVQERVMSLGIEALKDEFKMLEDQIDRKEK